MDFLMLRDHRVKLQNDTASLWDIAIKHILSMALSLQNLPYRADCVSFHVALSALVDLIYRDEQHLLFHPHSFFLFMVGGTEEAFPSSSV